LTPLGLNVSRAALLWLSIMVLVGVR